MSAMRHNEQEYHNMMNDIDKEYREKEYRLQIASAEHLDQLRTMIEFGHMLKEIDPMEKMNHFSDWVDYRINYSQIGEKHFPPMSFDMYVVQKIAPFTFHSSLGVCKPAKIYLYYV